MKSMNRRKRQRQFAQLHVESLEQRRLLTTTASEFFSASVASSAQIDPVETAGSINIRLETTNEAGEPILSAGVGDIVVLSVYVQDVRDNPTGVYAAFVDVSFNPKRVEPGAVEYGASYPGSHFDPSFESSLGLLRSLGAGAASSTPLGGAEQLLFRLPFRTVTAGRVFFAADPSGEVDRNFLVYGQSSHSPQPANIVYTNPITSFEVRDDSRQNAVALALLDTEFDLGLSFDDLLSDLKTDTATVADALDSDFLSTDWNSLLTTADLLQQQPAKLPATASAETSDADTAYVSRTELEAVPERLNPAELRELLRQVRSDSEQADELNILEMHSSAILRHGKLSAQQRHEIVEQWLENLAAEEAGDKTTENRPIGRLQGEFRLLDNQLHRIDFVPPAAADSHDAAQCMIDIGQIALGEVTTDHALPQAPPSIGNCQPVHRANLAFEIETLPAEVPVEQTAEAKQDSEEQEEVEQDKISDVPITSAAAVSIYLLARHRRQRDKQRK